MLYTGGKHRTAMGDALTTFNTLKLHVGVVWLARPAHKRPKCPAIRWEGLASQTILGVPYVPSLN